MQTKITLAVGATLVTMLVKEKIDHRKTDKKYEEALDNAVEMADIVLKFDKQIDYLHSVLETNGVPCTEFDRIVLNQLT